MITPRRPAGTSSEAIWAQWVHDTLVSLCQQQVQGRAGGMTTRGFYSLPSPVVASAAPTESARVKMFRVKSFYSDCIGGVEWDGTTETGGEVLIAKPSLLRCSITERTIDGVTLIYNYSGYADTTWQTRDEYDGSLGSDRQVVTPKYQENDVIYAIELDHTGAWQPLIGGTEAKWIDINVDARAWCGAYQGWP